MSKTTIDLIAHDRPDNTNLSASRALDGISEEAAAILAVDSTADRRSDSSGEVTDPSPIAPPARTTRRGFIMNSIVSAASIASATALVANTTEAGVPLANSREATIARAQQMVGYLGERVVP
jgi:hypothetical protein